MGFRIALGLAAVRVLAGFIFFLIAGLRLGVPGRFPVSRAIAAAGLAAGLGVVGPPVFSWPLYPIALAAALPAFYRPTVAWVAAAMAAGLIVEGAILLGIA